ncbi:MAG: tetratricopeptide repeat protein, partial [Deinococcales bacterium]
MPPRRLLLVSLLAAGGLLLGGVGLRGQLPAADAQQIAVYDPYAAAPLRPFASFRDAVRSGDALALQKLAAGTDGYLAYGASGAAAWNESKAGFAAALRGRSNVAALPLAGAAAGLERLVNDRRQLARDLLDARMDQQALAALRGLSDPPVEAQAQLDLDNYGKALPAYRQWVAAEPSNLDARTGLAWTLFYLGRYDEADALFQRLTGASALYGRALIANKHGDVDTAVRLLLRTGRADDMWRATGMLEAKQRYADAIPIYLSIARGGSSYADDAAYRAYVLAERLGMTATASTAKGLIPADSFFALKLGRLLDVPRPAPAAVPSGRVAAARSGATGLGNPLTDVQSAVEAAAAGLPRAQAQAFSDTLRLAEALVAVHDPSAAVGELLFELRALGATTDAPVPPAASAEPAVVHGAQMLQSLGDAQVDGDGVGVALLGFQHARGPPH